MECSTHTKGVNSFNLPLNHTRLDDKSVKLLPKGTQIPPPLSV